MSSAARKALERGLAELELVASPAQVADLTALAQRVASWGERINLTGHRGELAVVRRLLLDAVALLRAAPDFESLADLGSGAGFPGLPIAILRPEIEITLVEARQRRHHFQRAICRELGLANVKTVRGRAEELPATQHRAVVAQAVAQADRVLGWMLSWAAPNGWLLIPGGEHPPKLSATHDVLDIEVRSYQVPESGPERTLWIARRRP